MRLPIPVVEGHFIRVSEIKPEITVFNSASKQPIITEAVSMDGEEWRAMNQAFREALECRRPSPDMVQQLCERRRELMASLSPQIMRMRFQQELAGMFEEDEDGDEEPHIFTC